ncbi:hypothetical protein C9994_09375 [Marivirga lumbricoides]|uniref:SnoaL-like domain-containing protein n=1 Tax=Marivirga lumbricoides TaxID=1046115 RepID=A0A2T4DQB8_9BACT|nr:hypothetical protein C9994_09375 [Marivirga lumbricoides]
MKPLTITTLFFLLSFNLYCQNKKADSLSIMTIITDVFDGMRTSDTSLMIRHFHEDAIMQSIGSNKDGTNKLSPTSLPEGWFNAVAQPKAQIWDERTWNYQLQFDDKLATVWMDYAFYIDKSLSHCGVNSFTLAKIDNVWKIIYIIDTRNRDNCKPPEYIQNQ